MSDPYHPSLRVVLYCLNLCKNNDYLPSRVEFIKIGNLKGKIHTGISMLHNKIANIPASLMINT